MLSKERAAAAFGALRLLKRPPHPTLLLGEEKEEHLHHRSQAGVPKLCKSFPSKAINLNEG